MIEQVKDILTVGELGALSVGFTEAAGVVTDHLVRLAEQVKLVLPHTAIGNTCVNQQDCSPGSSDLIVQMPLEDRGETFGGVISIQHGLFLKKNKSIQI